MPTALITGITGQDGSYLADLLVSKGYYVHGTIRRSSVFNTERIEHLYVDPHEQTARLFLHYCDMSDALSLSNLLHRVRPDEIYHLAAQSHVRVSFDLPEYTADVVGTGTLRLLQVARDYRDQSQRDVRIYLAGSSEMFGSSPPPQNERTPFYPRSPYAISKVASYWFGVNYREAYNMFICNGILFNHESPRRGETFVTRKITRAVGRIFHGLQSKIYLGNLDARRDWGYAGDYVEAMWLMLQQSSPDDFVISTGESHSVREFLELSFDYVGLNWRDYLEIDSRYMRPTEVDSLLGDASKARTKLGWTPRVSFSDLAKMMIDSDLALASREKLCRST